MDFTLNLSSLPKNYISKITFSPIKTTDKHLVFFKGAKAIFTLKKSDSPLILEDILDKISRKFYTREELEDLEISKEVKYPSGVDHVSFKIYLNDIFSQKPGIHLDFLESNDSELMVIEGNKKEPKKNYSRNESLYSVSPQIGKQVVDLNRKKHQLLELRDKLDEEVEQIEEDLILMPSVEIMHTELMDQLWNETDHQTRKIIMQFKKEYHKKILLKLKDKVSKYYPVLSESNFYLSLMDHGPQEKPCPVCYEPIEDYVSLSCNHVFCRDCVHTADTCPICREDITDVRTLYFS